MFSAIRSKYNQWVSYKNKVKETNKIGFYIIDWAETIVVCLVLVLLIRRYIVQTSLVFSGSMHPTMQVGDRLFVNRFVFRFRHPERGEIILFDSPYGDRKQFVKRLIALPGERVKIDKGVVYINGEVLSLPGINVQNDYSYYDEVVVPEGSYFVLGDNRANSSDSRFWGFVKKDDLLGKAVYTFWPPSRMQTLR